MKTLQARCRARRGRRRRGRRRRATVGGVLGRVTHLKFAYHGASRERRASLTRVARVRDRRGRGDRNPQNCVPSETAATPPPICACRNHRVLDPSSTVSSRRRARQQACPVRAGSGRGTVLAHTRTACAGCLNSGSLSPSELTVAFWLLKGCRHHRLRTKISTVRRPRPTWSASGLWSLRASWSGRACVSSSSLN